MLFREGSDAKLRIKLYDVQSGVILPVDLDDYDVIQLVIKFADEKLLTVIGEPEENETYSIVDFSVYSENTKGKVGKCIADVRGIKGSKQVRFNKKTLKGKVLSSVKVP